MASADLLVGRLASCAALLSSVDHLDESGGEGGLVVGIDEPPVRTSGGGVHERERSARPGRDHGQPAGHRFQIDLAKRLVDRWGYEHIGCIEPLGQIVV